MHGFGGCRVLCVVFDPAGDWNDVGLTDESICFLISNGANVVLPEPSPLFCEPMVEVVGGIDCGLTVVGVVGGVFGGPACAVKANSTAAIAKGQKCFMVRPSRPPGPRFWSRARNFWFSEVYVGTTIGAMGTSAVYGPVDFIPGRDFCSAAADA